MGIRNYIKYLYDNYVDGDGNHSLAYVLLLGDATEDFLNHASSQGGLRAFKICISRGRHCSHFPPTSGMRTSTPRTSSPDTPIDDVAVGRLPAASQRRSVVHGRQGDRI